MAVIGLGSTLAVRTQQTTFTPSFSVAITSRIYMQATEITATTDLPGKVTFSVSGRTVPGCSAIKTTGVATCNWKPSVMGSVIITAVFTPTNTAYAIMTRSLTIKVTPR